MTGALAGLRVAFLAADGVEQVEHETPWRALVDQGALPELLSFAPGHVQAFTFPEPGAQFVVDRTVNEASVDDYAGLVIPGGTASPDLLRENPETVDFVRAVHSRDLPVAAICHAPWLLIEAGLARGRRLTSWPSIATDIRNAGGDWIDKEVVIDRGVITSRGPADLAAFCEATITALQGTHRSDRPYAPSQ